MKKTLIAASLAGLIGLVGITAAHADPGWGGGPGYGDCDGPANCSAFNGGPRGGGRDFTEAEQAARDKFFKDTQEVRRSIAVTRAELGALMQQDNPDETKVAAATGTLFDLRAQMRDKAAELKIGGGFGGNGPGCGGPGGPGNRGPRMMMRGW